MIQNQSLKFAEDKTTKQKDVYCIQKEKPCALYIYIDEHRNPCTILSTIVTVGYGMTKRYKKPDPDDAVMVMIAGNTAGRGGPFLGSLKLS